MIEQNKEFDFSTMLTPKPNESSVNYVINNIKELLLTKKIKPGDRIPSEMELAKCLSVSRGSIREAMKILAAFGIIEIKRGDGTYVSSNMDGKILFDPLLFSFILSQPEFGELQEFRLLLEKDVIFLVIKNAADEEIQALRDCHAIMETLDVNSERNDEKVLECDLEFHYILSRMTKNRILERIYNFILEYFRPYIEQSIHKHTYFSLESKETHKKILEAIENRDYVLAEKAVENSVKVWKELIFK